MYYMFFMYIYVFMYCMYMYVLYGFYVYVLYVCMYIYGFRYTQKQEEKLNFEIVKRQVFSACKNLGIKQMGTVKLFIDFFYWYYGRYHEIFRKDHKNLKTVSIEGVISNIMSFDDIMYDDEPIEVLKMLAEKYFTCQFSSRTDYSITHFACPEILQNRMFETML